MGFALGSMSCLTSETNQGKLSALGACLNFWDTVTDWLNSLDPRLVAYALQILRASVWLLILAIVFTPLERLFAVHPQKIFRKGFVTDVGYYFLNSVVPGFLLSFPLALLAWCVHRYLPVGFVALVTALPLWARLTLGMVVGEIGFYWGHRWSHEIPLLWRFHAVHHSAEDVDYLVSVRGHPVDQVFSRLCELAPMYALGLASPMAIRGSMIPIVVTLIGVVWGFFIHANVRWRFGPLEWLVSTPAFHHWHHTNDGPTYVNKNYAPMLPWIDWIFGTLYLPKDRQPERYGIDEPISPVLFGQLVDPFLVWRKPGPSTPSGASSDEVGDQGAGLNPEAVLTSEIDA
jgi:sterol desaturase/sphingolipid hydroxylase (fatty acid hydroxylase superfamily)